MNLPKIVFEKKNRKKKILLLSDDLRLHSGIATMSREFVLGTCDRYDWVQLGAALQNPDHGKVLDLSQDIEQRTGQKDVNVKVVPWNGYGDARVLRELMEVEKPDAIMHFTDPRFWGWLYAIEDEVRETCPIIYYAIWDDAPVPHWNANSYQSCDLIMGISKQSHNLHKLTLADRDVEVVDLDEQEYDEPFHAKDKILTAYVPHGIDADTFKPIPKDDKEFNIFKDNFIKKNGEKDFIIFWNNRNIRRKQPGDLLLAYKKFCDTLTPEQVKRVALLMHTQVRDENGTDLLAVRNAICPNEHIIFSLDKVEPKLLNYLYNLADVTINVASNEGFGLSGAESLMAGTPIINNVTGGLQDQCNFKDEEGKTIEFTPEFTSNHTGKYKECGEWVYPLFPTNRSLQGSVATPYIFDDRCSFDDIASAMSHWYNTTLEERKAAGEKGRQWLSSPQSGMSSVEMANRMKKHIDTLLKNWKPAKVKFKMTKVGKKKNFKYTGITW